MVRAHLRDKYASTLLEKFYFGAWLVLWTACYSGWNHDGGTLMCTYLQKLSGVHRIRQQLASAFKNITCG